DDPPPPRLRSERAHLLLRRARSKARRSRGRGADLEGDRLRLAERGLRRLDLGPSKLASPRREPLGAACIVSRRSYTDRSWGVRGSHLLGELFGVRRACEDARV